MTISGILPVIGLQIVFLTVQASVHAADGGLGIDLAIEADETLSGGDAEHVVAQSKLFVVKHVGINPLIGGGSRESVAIESIVVQLTIVYLGILLGVGDDVIVLHGAARAAPFGLEVDVGFANVAFLCGNQDDTGGTTGTIQCCAGGILQHGDALDVLLRNIAQGSRIGSTVYDDQRCGGSIE